MRTRSRSMQRMEIQPQMPRPRPPESASSASAERGSLSLVAEDRVYADDGKSLRSQSYPSARTDKSSPQRGPDKARGELHPTEKGEGQKFMHGTLLQMEHQQLWKKAVYDQGSTGALELIWAESERRRVLIESGKDCATPPTPTRPRGPRGSRLLFGENVCSSACSALTARVRAKALASIEHEIERPSPKLRKMINKRDVVFDDIRPVVGVMHDINALLQAESFPEQFLLERLKGGVWPHLAPGSMRRLDIDSKEGAAEAAKMHEAARAAAAEPWPEQISRAQQHQRNYQAARTAFVESATKERGLKSKLTAMMRKLCPCCSCCLPARNTKKVPSAMQQWEWVVPQSSRERAGDSTSTSTSTTKSNVVVPLPNANATAAPGTAGAVLGILTPQQETDMEQESVSSAEAAGLTSQLD